MKKEWDKGDFGKVAAFMRESGEAVAKELGSPGMSVLDVGCGDGTTAIPFAQLGCKVVGVDIAPNLVQAGNDRCMQLGLDQSKCRFEVGDAGNLENIPDNSYDLAFSQFGAMFCPRPVDAARELYRVARDQVIMHNWIPGDETFVTQQLMLFARYGPPPPPGFVRPILWGDKKTVLERFAEAANVPEEDIQFEKKTYWIMDEKVSMEEFIDILIRYVGPAIDAYEAATQNGKKDEFVKEFLDLGKRCNKATDGTIKIQADYLRVTVKKRK